MNRIVVLPLDFLGQGALLEPVDQKLHDLAVEYVAHELVNGRDLNLAKFTKCWVVVEFDSTTYKAMHGIAGWCWRVDVPVFRVSGENAVRATKMLVDRMRSYFMDQGARGADVFVHVSSKETPEQRCANWQQSLDAVGAVPADRFLLKV